MYHLVSLKQTYLSIKCVVNFYMCFNQYLIITISQLYIMVVGFYWWRQFEYQERITHGKSLINFITNSCIEVTSPFA